MSDRIAVMFDGEIGQLDDPETLYRQPKSRRVAEFIGKMNFLPAKVITSGATISLDVAGLGSCTIAAAQAPNGATDGAIGIRPETLAILFDGEAAKAREVAAVVDEVVYYGDMTYYDVRIEDAPEPLTIAMKNLIGRPVLEVGDAARVGWDTRALVLL